MSKASSARGDFTANRRLIFISVVSLVIGGASAFVAKFLLLLISLFTHIFYFGRISVESVAPSSEHWGVWFIFVPVVGGLIIGLMARFGSEKIRGHGIPEALEAILYGKSIMQPKVAILKPISSAISIGSGGPFGAEGPIIMTGGAVGSLIAQFFDLTSVERKTLLVAGSAAGMTAIFATPVAAVLLSVELLLFEWKPRSLVPVTIACAVSMLVRLHLFGHGPLFPVPVHGEFSDLVLLESIGVGLSAGVFATLISKTLYRLEDLFQKLPIHWMWWPAIGGAVVGMGGWYEPRALGVGYDVIADLLNGRLPQAHVAALLAVKASIWIFALASGTSGGVLAPLLIFGCALGTLEAPWLAGDVSAATWSLIAMGAILGGMMRAPFTAILFCFELTRDGDSLLPLLIATLSSYAFTVLAMKRSILTEKISRRGYDVFREYGIDPLERYFVKEIMTPDPEVIASSSTVSQVFEEKFARPRHRGYPVVAFGDKTKLLGILTSSDLARVPSLDEMNDLTARDLIQRLPITVTMVDTCRLAADRMAEHGIGRILVIDPDDQDVLMGIVTRSDLLKVRQHHLHEESRRERIFSGLIKT